MSTLVAGRRRWSLLGVAAAILAAVGISLIFSLSPARSTSGGSAYSQTNAVDTNPDPNILETTITSDESTVDLGQGITANAQAYNGGIPGPTLRLKVNDTVIVHYENKLEHESGIHWHGIEVSNGMDGTPLTQNQVQPGGTFLYKFKVTRPGLFWYHPHHHSSTNQVFKGLYGMIVVTDPNEAALQSSAVIPAAADTYPVVLSDTTVCKAPGSNPEPTYSPAQPHVTGGGTPAQQGPSQKDICEDSPVDEDGEPTADYGANDIPAIQTKASSGRINEGYIVLTNGRNVGGRAGTPTAPGALAAGAETLPVKARQGVRLQLLNAATTRYMRLRLTTNTGTMIPLTRIGGEGGLINNAVDEGSVYPLPAGTIDHKFDRGEILLPPGTRADVAFGIPAGTTGPATLWTEDFDRTGMNFANIPTVPVMHFNVSGSVPVTYDIAGGDPIRAATGDLVPTIGAPVNVLLNPAAFAPPKKGMASQNIQLTQGGTFLGVDTHKGDHDITGDYKDADHMLSSRYAKEGDQLQLDVQNTTNANHPFHLHGFSIQPRTLTKAGDPTFTWTYPEFRDNVDIPKGYTLRFRVRIEPRPMPDDVTPGGALGRWVFHCHIFFHATNGMLSELVVTSAAGNERPDVEVNGATSTVEQGGEATMTGSYKDKDGDPVTLSVPFGTVTDDGGGKWTWKYSTAGDETDKIVGVTATDTGGRKGQATFQLDTVNSPPSVGLPGDQTVTQFVPASIGVSATDPNPSDAVGLSASGLPAGLSLTDNGNRTGTITGATTAPPGEYLATIAANDGKNPATAATQKITVLPGKEMTGVATNPEVMKRGAITVGCRLVRNAIKSCRATVTRKNKRIGRATKTLPATGNSLANVAVPLTRATQRSVARSVPGVGVNIGFLAFAFDAVPSLADAVNTRVVASRVVARPSLAVFGATSAGITKAGKAYLTKVAKQVGTAKRVTCTARPPRAKARATAACKYLKARGLKSKTSSVGAGRPSSRRLALTISR